MNISQHTFLPYKWRLGNWRPSGVGAELPSMLSHWFYPSLVGFRIFPTPHAIELYGNILVRPSAGSSVPVLPYVSLDVDGTVLDSSSPDLPSHPFSYILY